MAGFGWQEIIVIGLVCVVVVGPSHLPQLVRTITVLLRRIRAVSDSVRYEISRLSIEDEFDDINEMVTSDLKEGKSILDKTIGEIPPLLESEQAELKEQSKTAKKKEK